MPLTIFHLRPEIKHFSHFPRFVQDIPHPSFYFFCIAIYIYIYGKHFEKSFIREQAES